MSIQNKLKKWFEEGNKGERHKGLRKIGIDNEKIKNHLIKAEHNMKAIAFFKKKKARISF